MAHKNQSKSRRRYDATFKAEVIQMIANGRSVPDVARSLGIGENIIYRWRQKALGVAEPSVAECGTAPAQVSLSEHLALQKRLRELELERDILKKALGIFSRPA